MAQVDQSCLDKLKTFRKKFDWKDEKQRHQTLHGFFFLIDNCEGNLPNLRDIFEPREIDWLVGSRDKEGQTLLHLAVTRANKKATELLLRNGSDPNLVKKSGLMAPLHIICDSKKNKESAVFLKMFFDINDELNQRVKVKTQDFFGRTALHLALKHNNTEVTELLLRRGANPDLPMKDGSNPLLMICRKGNDHDGAFLLKMFFEINDANHHTLQVNAQNKFGQSPLHCAVEYNFKIAAELLLRRGANPNLTMKDGSTPLHMIFSMNKYFNNDDERATFVKIFCDINDELHQTINVDVLDNRGRSPLHYAVERRLKNTTDSLLRGGADPNFAAKGGYTPLLLALKNEDFQVAEVLLKRGANPIWTTTNGWTILHLVCQKRDELEVSKFLKLFFEINDDKNYQVQIDARDERGQTPLCMALDFGRTKVAEVLLRNGANPNLANKEGSTPLHIICAGDYDDILPKFLTIFFHISDEKHQTVQVDAHDKWGRTPLQLALKNFLLDVVDVLLDRGAVLSSFVIPTGRDFDVSFKVLNGHACKLERVSKLLVVVERLEKRGYELDLRNALTIVKTFAKCGLFEKSRDLEFLCSNEELISEAEGLMINPRLSLYDWIWMRPKKAEKLLTYVDYLELARSKKLRKLSYDSRMICTAQLCEIMSRRFRRRWTMEFFLVLTQYQLPILCCEKIIDFLKNEDLLGICQAAEIVVEEET